MLDILAMIIATTPIGAAPSMSIHLPSVPAIVSDEPPPSPVGLAIGADHSVWVSMNTSGRIIHVVRGRPSIVVASRESAPLDLVALPDGRILYNQFSASDTGTFSDPIPTIGCVGSRGPCASIPFPPPFGRIDGLVANDAGDVAAFDATAGVYGRRTASGIRIHAPPKGYGVRTIGVSDDGAFWFAFTPTSTAAPPSWLIIRIDRAGRTSTKLTPAGESVEVFARYGSGVLYSAWVAPGNRLVRTASASSEGEITFGAPHPIPGGGGDFVAHQGNTWFVPNNVTGVLRRLTPNGVIRTVEPSVLRGQTIDRLAADGDTLWCTTVQGWLYAFSFTSLNTAVSK